MSAELRELSDDITLHADGKGIFDVTVDGKLVYSKYETGRFPDPGELKSILLT